MEHLQEPQENECGFEGLSLSAPMLESLANMGFVTPSPIQIELIPRALAGVDVIGQAKTGTGKTAAFIIPILERLVEQNAPQAMVLVPTRELAQQVKEEAVRLAGNRSIGILAVYGGEELRKQANRLAGSVQLVVGTPGRVLDLMARRILNVEHLRTVVLDEADRMLDIGFRPDIERILKYTPKSRQTLLLSATLPPPVQALARRYMHDPEMINLSPDELSVANIEQFYFTVDEDRKLHLLLRLLIRERPRQCLIFCQMKSSVRRLATDMARYVRSVRAMSGDLAQNVRNRVMQEFREGKTRILVATDVVGRGIDVEGISHVVNYDIPEDPEAYVHRVGRTGRMGKDGKAFTLVTPEQGYLLTNVEQFTGRMLTPDELENFVAFRPREPKGQKSGEAAQPNLTPTRYRRAL